MPRNPSSTQINQFMSTTSCPDKKFAKEHLKKFNNDVQNAINDYFDKNLGAQFTTTTVTPGNSKSLFDKYKGKK